MLPPFLIVMDEVVFSSSSCTYEGCRFVHELEWSQLLLCRRDDTVALGCGTATLLICSMGVLHLCIRVVSGIWYNSNLRSFHFCSMYILWSYITNGHFLDCCGRPTWYQWYWYWAFPPSSTLDFSRSCWALLVWPWPNLDLQVLVLLWEVPKRKQTSNIGKSLLNVNELLPLSKTLKDVVNGMIPLYCLP